MSAGGMPISPRMSAESCPSSGAGRRSVPGARQKGGTTLCIGKLPPSGSGMYTSDARCRMKESSSNWRASRTGPMVTSAIFEVPQHVCPRPERDELLNGSVDRVDVGHPRGICGEPGIGDQVSPAEGAEEQLGHRLRQRTRRPARRPRTCKRFAEPPRSRGWPAGGGAGRSVSIGRVRAEAAHHGVGAPSDETMALPSAS